MTGATLVDILIDRGLDRSEAVPKRALFDAVVARLDGLPSASAADGRGAGAWWVPGRLEVFGKHTDYAGGRTLVCAVPRGVAVVARSRSDGALYVLDVKREQDVTLFPSAASSETQALPGWRRYVAVVARRLTRNFPGVALAGDIVIASDLPRASGMSSSSALMIAIATALVRLCGIDQRREWMENIAGPHDAAGYYACIENGSSFGTLAGDEGVGTHGGSEDHAAILTATPRELSAFAFVPMRAIARTPVPEGWRFVLTPCGVPAQKAGAAREAYNRLAEGVRLLLDLWNQDASQSAASLGAALGGQSPESVEQMRALVRRSRISGWPSDALERRLDHFIREDARVADALESFRTANASQVGLLAEGSQLDAERLLGNQIPETSALARSARSLGALAACSFGAGFGGSLWALVERDRAASFAERWHAEAFVARPGPPLVELAVPGQS